MDGQRRLPCLLAFLIGCALLAQDDFARFGARPDGQKSVEAFAAGIARGGIPVLVLLGAEEKAVAGRWESLLQEEALADLDLKPRRLRDGEPLAQELRRRFTWAPGPRWAAFGKAGTVLATEAGVPASATALAGRLLAAGFEGPIQLYEAFLRQHPDHAEAMEALVKARLEQATRRLRAWRTREASREAPLPDAEDARIFRSFAAALDRLMALPEWPSSIPNGLGFAKDAPAPRSAILSALARRHLPAVEAQVGRTPGSARVWSAWLFLADAAGGRSIGALLDSIEPRPDGLGQPPAAAILRLADELRSAKAWPRMAAMFGPLFERQLKRPLFLPVLGGEGVASVWDRYTAPLVEAQLHSGLLAEADDVVRRFLAWSAWPQTPAKAAALARACQQPRMAAAWEALALPEQAR